jgi:hypothetical protein
MKCIKTIALAGMVLLRVSGVAAAKHTHHATGTAYYSITDGHGGFVWVKVLPTGCSCQVRPDRYCTIIVKAGHIPSPNIIPTPSEAILIGADSFNTLN